MPEQLEEPDKPEKTAASQKAITLNVQLAPGGAGDQPVLANYAAVSLASGIAHVDFGFIEPVLFGALGRAIRANKPIPKGVRGARVARVALPLDTLVRLQQQLQQVVADLQGAATGRMRKQESRGQA
jgi:hypothetical protein